MASKDSPRLFVTLGLAGVIASAVGLAAAQQMCAQGRAAIDQTTRAVTKLDRELTCLREKRERLARILVLLAQSDGQAHSSALSAREREDGETAIVSLRRQAADLERESQRCVEEAMIFATTETAHPVTQVVPPPPDAVADDVARPSDGARVVERDTRFTDDVHVVVGEQVDGTGAVESASVRAGVRAIGSRVGGCYELMLTRRALREGTMILLFDVTSGGRVARVRIENDTLSEPELNRCVRQAGEALRFDRGASGGTATYAYTLQFGG